MGSCVDDPLQGPYAEKKCSDTGVANFQNVHLPPLNNGQSSQRIYVKTTARNVDTEALHIFPSSSAEILAL